MPDRHDMRRLLFAFTLCAIALTLALGRPSFSQDEPEAAAEEPAEEEGLLPDIPLPGEEGAEAGSTAEEGEPSLPADRIVGGAAREGETRWGIDITGAVVINYVFNDQTTNFTVKYSWEVKGQANAEAAVIRGEAEVNADVEGPLSKWPTGECKLEVSVPKVPFELSFRRAGADKGSIKLLFKQAINEDWQSKCTFTDAPGAKFDTRGSPETWLSKALEKARPPLKDIIADIGEEEVTTRFVINKEVIPDPPLGSGEIEGTGVVTIRPGG